MITAVAKRYFNAAHCNPDWHSLESQTAMRERGRGWSTFCKAVRAERGNKCEICGLEEMSCEQKAQLTRPERQRRELHLHHKQKVRLYRHLRFERGNVVVCCIACHLKLEAQLDAELATSCAEEIYMATKILFSL
jgi:hypothetical protein